MTRAAFACGVCVTAFACAQIAGISDGPGTTIGRRSDGGVVASKADGISLSAEELEVRIAGCDKKSSVETLEITNGRKKSLEFTAEFAGGTGFAVEGAGADGVLRAEIEPDVVKPVGVSVTTGTPGPQEADLILNFIGEPADKRVQRVRVKATVGGGKLTFLPSIADFGEVRYQNPGADIPVLITNTGTANLKIDSFASAGVFKVTWSAAGGLVVPAGHGVLANVSFPSSNAADPALLEQSAEPVIAESLHCGVVPRLRISGRRIATDVNVEPNTIDFGRQYCNGIPAEKTITLKSYATNQAYNFTATLPVGSRYTVSPAAGPLPAMMAAVLTIKPSAIAAQLPANALTAEDLLITFDVDPGGGGKTRTAKVNMEIRGVTFEITPPSLLFAVDADGGTQNRSFTIKNTGNVAGVYANYTFTPTEGAGAFTVEKDDFFGPATNDIDVKFMPPDAGTYAGQITTTVEGDPPLCVPAPTVTVTGTRP